MSVDSKHRRLFGNSKPGGCLDPALDEDRQPYKPGKIKKDDVAEISQIIEVPVTQCDTIGKKNKELKTKKLKLFSRSKRGGCLDPGYDEDSTLSIQRSKEDSKGSLKMVRISGIFRRKKSGSSDLIDDQIKNNKLDQIVVISTPLIEEKYLTNKSSDPLITYPSDSSENVSWEKAKRGSDKNNSLIKKDKHIKNNTDGYGSIDIVNNEAKNTMKNIINKDDLKKGNRSICDNINILQGYYSPKRQSSIKSKDVILSNKIRDITNKKEKQNQIDVITKHTLKETNTSENNKENLSRIEIKSFRPLDLIISNDTLHNNENKVDTNNIIVSSSFFKEHNSVTSLNNKSSFNDFVQEQLKIELDKKFDNTGSCILETKPSPYSLNTQYSMPNQNFQSNEITGQSKTEVLTTHSKIDYENISNIKKTIDPKIIDDTTLKIHEETVVKMPNKTHATLIKCHKSLETPLFNDDVQMKKENSVSILELDVDNISNSLQIESKTESILMQTLSKTDVSICENENKKDYTKSSNNSIINDKNNSTYNVQQNSSKHSINVQVIKNQSNQIALIDASNQEALNNVCKISDLEYDKNKQLNISNIKQTIDPKIIDDTTLKIHEKTVDKMSNETYATLIKCHKSLETPLFNDDVQMKKENSVSILELDVDNISKSLQIESKTESILMQTLPKTDVSIYENENKKDYTKSSNNSMINDKNYSTYNIQQNSSKHSNQIALIGASNQEALSNVYKITDLEYDKNKQLNKVTRNKSDLSQYSINTIKKKIEDEFEMVRNNQKEQSSAILFKNSDFDPVDINFSNQIEEQIEDIVYTKKILSQLQIHDNIGSQVERSSINSSILSINKINGTISKNSLNKAELEYMNNIQNQFHPESAPLVNHEINFKSKNGFSNDISSHYRNTSSNSKSYDNINQHLPSTAASPINKSSKQSRQEVRDSRFDTKALAPTGDHLIINSKYSRKSLNSINNIDPSLNYIQVKENTTNLQHDNLTKVSTNDKRNFEVISATQGNEHIKLDFAFKSYVNNKNELIIKSDNTDSLDPKNSTFTVFKNTYNGLMPLNIPLDTERDIIINFSTRPEKTIYKQGSNSMANNTLSNDNKKNTIDLQNMNSNDIHNRDEKKDYVNETIMTTGKNYNNTLGKILNKNNLTDNKVREEKINEKLLLIYELEMVPLQNIIKELRVQIDMITEQQKVFRQVLRGMKQIKPVRYNIRKCACVRKY